MLKLPVYMDHNATTPCDERVVEAMLPFFSISYGNAASRSHLFGWEANEAVKKAREQVAALVGAEPGEIIFTSGATESDNLAIRGVLEMYAGKGNHIITTVIEHKAVLDTCIQLEKSGAEISYMPVDPLGMIDTEQLEALIKPTTVLICVMYANNETGNILPIKTIGDIAKKHGVLFFTDATQAVGKVPVNVMMDNIDLMAFSAHKLYGPKGVGALFMRRRDPRVRLTAQILGGGHEKGIRSGTLNVPGIVGFGKACAIASENMKTESRRMFELRKRLEKGLLSIEGTTLNGDRESRLPNTSNISFKYADGDGLLMSINKNIAVSTGSACTSASIEPSYVLKAMGLDDETAHNTLRFSLGRYNNEEEVDYVIEQVKETVIKLRALSPQWESYK